MIEDGRNQPSPFWMANRKSLGRWGEEQAAAHLIKGGYRLLARNWHCRQGEIDLIVQQNNEYIFVEVKTRCSPAAGSPEEALTPQKAAKLIQLAQIYLAKQELDVPWRIDLMAVECDAGGNLLRCEHFPFAVWGW